MAWTTADSAIVLGPLIAGAAGAIVASIRGGYRSVIARIDHTETRIMGRLDQVELEQTHQGRVIANHGERLAWIEGSQNRPLGSTPRSPENAQNPGT